MVNKDIGEKVKVNGFLELLKVSANSWVEINGHSEFKIPHRSLRRVDTIFTEGNFACKNHYYLNPTLHADYVEKFSILYTAEGKKYYDLIMENK